MQALIATLDGGLYASIVALLSVLQPDGQPRRAYNEPEINALLEGEQFSLAFFDANMPGYGTQFTANDLAQWYPQTRFFVLGGDTAMRLDRVAVQPSVSARPAATLRPPVLAGMGGGGRNLADLMQVVEQVQLPNQVQLAEPGTPSLTGRQIEVLRLVREGKATKEIARQLNLAVPTVKTHLAALYRQLGVRNRVEAAMMQTAPTQSAVVRAFPTQRPEMPRPEMPRLEMPRLEMAAARAPTALSVLRAVG